MRKDLQDTTSQRGEITYQVNKEGVHQVLWLTCSSRSGMLCCAASQHLTRVKENIHTRYQTKPGKHHDHQLQGCATDPPKMLVTEDPVLQMFRQQARAVEQGAGDTQRRRPAKPSTRSPTRTLLRKQHETSNERNTNHTHRQLDKQPRTKYIIPAEKHPQ